MKPKPDMAVLYVYPVHSILYSIFGQNTTLMIVGPLQRVRPRNGIVVVVVVVVLPLRSEFIGEL